MVHLVPDHPSQPSNQPAAALRCPLQAFLELSSHEEALDMVDYYKQNPASLYGKPVSFYLSETLLVIEVRVTSDL